VVSFTTLPGLSYDVQRASDLPVSDWSVVASNIAGTGEVMQIADLNATSQARRFYQLRLSP